MKPLAYLLTAAATLAVLPISAYAQDTSAEPTYETVDLEAGFNNDPYTVSLSSGGSVSASTLSEDCAGFIADAPDVRLNYSAGSLPLYVSAASEVDTTLVINAPDGQWYCDDDGNGGLDPLVWFEQPQSGQYDIWVGTYSDSSIQSATLSISEISSGSSDEFTDDGDPTGTGINYGAQPAYGSVTLASGFANDPYTVELVAGGANDASQLGGSCTGTIAAAPDFRLHYTAGGYPLYIRSISDDDTTLAINGPNGEWYCDDDGAGDLNPLVRFDAPQSGRYDIYVGTFSGGANSSASLEISEIGPKK